MKTDTVLHTPQPDSSAWDKPKRKGLFRQRLFLKANWIAAVAFALLWFILINELRVEWTINPQYSYGWVVPLLALSLLLRRWSDRPPQNLTTLLPPSSFPAPLAPGLLCLFITCAAMILPLRLLLEATPGWRTLNLLLALSTIGLTLLGTFVAVGRWWTGHLAFPVCFMLVAVPWPLTIEAPLIQGLTQVNARLVVEFMSLLGVPAVHHGNVIEVSTGTVGIDEACSGIRSFQSSLMVSLFLGEFLRLGLSPRLRLVPLGFLVAFGFNVCRTGLLTWIAAQNGVAAVGEYHDGAGISILLACAGTMGVIAWLLHLRNQKAAIRKLQSRSPENFQAPHQVSAAITVSTQFTEPLRFQTRRSPSLRAFALPLVVWLITVEAGVELWYRAHESRHPKSPEWTLNWPPQESSFREEPVPPVSRAMLAYDEGHSGAWESGGGVYWKVYYFRWLPGRLALSAARSHTPNICLAAAGKQLRKLDDNHSPIQIGPLIFPFRRYEFMEEGRVVHVFHCLWEEHAAGTYFDFDPTSSQTQLRFRAALQGRRNLGQRSLEVFISGIEDPKVAEIAIAAQLQKLVQIVSPFNSGLRVRPSLSAGMCLQLTVPHGVLTGR